MAGQASTWFAAGYSVQGASHLRFGMPNQDAVAWSQDSGSALVLAVSDGHGASPHFRSDVGSRFAVESALKVVSGVLADPQWIERRDDVLGAVLVADVLEEWRGRVRAHWEAKPLTESETAYFGGDEFSPYGATLICAAVCPQGAFVMQLGDGDLLVGPVGEALFRPLPDDVGLVGEQTYSLCQPDAERYVRMQILLASEATLDFLMLSSDGLSKSFREPDGFHRTVAKWRAFIAQRGLSGLPASFSDTLSSISARGSGDDITIGFLSGSRGAT